MIDWAVLILGMVFGACVVVMVWTSWTKEVSDYPNQKDMRKIQDHVTVIKAFNDKVVGDHVKQGVIETSIKNKTFQVVVYRIEDPKNSIYLHYAIQINDEIVAKLHRFYSSTCHTYYSFEVLNNRDKKEIVEIIKSAAEASYKKEEAKKIYSTMKKSYFD
jgi:hypothetical protein